ncbi:MAG: hypothetical protein IAG10_16560 [Planctomycetaceae bacterium]|nr:hypothetical protein [Planctomycetaceae bacterium]
MRRIGLVLVMLGGLALGYEWLSHDHVVWGTISNAEAVRDSTRVESVTSGIVIVLGLLIVASSGRTED